MTFIFLKDKHLLSKFNCIVKSNIFYKVKQFFKIIYIPFIIYFFIILICKAIGYHTSYNPIDEKFKKAYFLNLNDKYFYKNTYKHDTSLYGTINGSGASCINPIMDFWKSELINIFPNVNIQYLPDGSESGKIALKSGIVDFAGSDIPIDSNEINEYDQVCGKNGVIDVPIYISSIAIAFNLPNIKYLNLDANSLANIFKGEIIFWDDHRILIQNPYITLPHLRITPVSRSDESGTTKNFTEYLYNQSSTHWPYLPKQSWPKHLRNENAKGTSGVVKTVTQTYGAITYTDESALSGKLGIVNLKVQDKYLSLLSNKINNTIEETDLLSNRMTDKDIVVNLNNFNKYNTIYPLIFVSYHLVCLQYSNEKTANLVKNFELYILSEEGQRSISKITKGSKLPEFLLKKSLDSINSIKVSRNES